MTNTINTTTELSSFESSTQSAILACAKTLLDDDSVDVALNTFLTIICEYFGGNRSYIFEVGNSFETLQISYEYNILAQPAWDAQARQLNIDIINDWFAITDIKDKIFIDSKNENKTLQPRELQLLNDLNINTAIIMPLLEKGKLIGVLGVNNPTKNTDDTIFLTTVSAFIINDLNKRELLAKLEKMSYRDGLTGLYNRNKYLDTINQLKKHPPKSLGIIFGDVNGLKKVNDNLGHEEGDILIKWCANFLVKHIKKPVYRIGGDEFVAFVADTSQEDFESYIQSMCDRLGKMNMFNISLGTTWSNVDLDIENQIKATDKLMYANKQIYYRSLAYRNTNLADETTELKSAIKHLIKDFD